MQTRVLPTQEAQPASESQLVQTLHPFSHHQLFTHPPAALGLASKGSHAPSCARSQVTTIWADTTKAQLKRSFLPVANKVKSFMMTNLVFFTFITSLEAYALVRVAE